MVVGQAMASGKMLYRDIWDDVGPLSALIYQTIDHLFGRSQLAYQLLSLCLVFVQAAIFNRLLLINKAFNENTYIPALVYIICASSNFEFLTLSPQLMSMTFVLLAINNIFKRIDNLTKDELFLNAGLYLGVSTLFYFPSFVFLLSTLLSLILFSSAIPRRLMLMSFGYVQLIVIVFIYYYWYDAAREFYNQYLIGSFTSSRNLLLSIPVIAWIMLVHIIFLLISIFKLYSRNYYVNYQVKFQSVMMITLMAALCTFFLEPNLSAVNLLYFIPVIAFFLSHLFLLIEKRTKAEIIFLLFLFANFGYQYIIDKEVRWVGQLVDFDPIVVKDSEYKNQVNGKRILVLGNDLKHYKEAELATPYLNWEYAESHMSNLDYYDVLTETFQNFERDPPEVIIDLENLGPQLMKKMPSIARQYVKSGPKIYVLRNN